MKMKRPSSVVGISFEVAGLQRGGAKPEWPRAIREQLRAPLSLNPLIDDPGWWDINP